VGEDDELGDTTHPYGDHGAAVDGFEQLPLMVVVTDGPDLRTIAFNAGARQITRGRLKAGEPVLDGFGPDLAGQGWPDALLTATSTGRSVSMDEARVQLHHADGTTTEHFLDSLFAPRLGADGRPRGCIMVSREVTARVRAREALEAELAELRQRYSQARGTVRDLQRALLADAVPVLPRLDVGARYVLASDEQGAGGDWFDVVSREDGSAVLVVGDVVGHGPAAAVAMGQLRSVLLSQLRAGIGPAQALAFLDGFAATVPEARRATVCVVEVGPDGGLLYSTAGHPPPLLLADAGGSRFLPPSGGGPLATGVVPLEATAHLAPGEMVVLYTDGILERPGVAPAAATTQLLGTAAAARSNTVMPVGAPGSAAERVCALTIELLTRSTGQVDDITLLAAQRRAPAPVLDLRLEPGPDAVARARAALVRWLDALGPGEDDVRVLLHAATELVANVVDHAYLGSVPGELRVRARLEPSGQVVLEVADRGSWKLPVLTGERGRGLALVRRLVDRLEVDRSPDGTTATVHQALRRPAGLLERRVAPPATSEREHFDVFAEAVDPPRVVVVGPLDAATAAETGAYLELALSEADDRASLDLSATTLLASAGVDLLFRVAERARAVGVELELVAPNGSPAQQVLDLVRLPYRAPMEEAS